MSRVHAQQTASEINHALSEELGVSGGWLRAGNRFFMGRDRIEAGEFVFRPKGSPGRDTVSTMQTPTS